MSKKLLSCVGISRRELIKEYYREKSLKGNFGGFILTENVSSFVKKMHSENFESFEIGEIIIDYTTLDEMIEAGFNLKTIHLKNGSDVEIKIIVPKTDQESLLKEKHYKFLKEKIPGIKEGLFMTN